MIISDGPGPVEVKLILQEHKCVLDSCRALEMEGFRVTYLPVQKNGLIDLKVSGPGVKGRVGTLECQWESVGNCDQEFLWDNICDFHLSKILSKGYDSITGVKIPKMCVC